MDLEVLCQLEVDVMFLKCSDQRLLDLKCADLVSGKKRPGVKLETIILKPKFIKFGFLRPVFRGFYSSYEEIVTPMESSN